MFTLEYEQQPAPGVMQESTRVQTWHDLSDVVCAYGYAGPGWWAMEWPALATFRVDSKSPTAVRVFAARDASRARIDDLYRRSVMPLFLQALGHETLHASAVRGSRGVLAFCGERGAGKSTVAYALARRGYSQYADDTLVMNVTSGAITTQPLPFVPRLRPASAEFFGAREADTSSAVTRPEPLDGVFILRPASAARRLSVTELPAPQALQALLAHAHCFEPDSDVSRQRLLRNYLEISARVSVLAVDYVPGLDGLDAMLDAILAAAGMACAASEIV